MAAQEHDGRHDRYISSTAHVPKALEFDAHARRDRLRQTENEEKGANERAR